MEIKDRVFKKAVPTPTKPKDLSSDPDNDVPQDPKRVAAKIVYQTDTVDPQTRLPIVVIDSSALPEPSSKSHAILFPHLVNNLPNQPFVLVFFACGAPQRPSWSWATKTYAMIERDVKKRVRKVYVVHESWWVRAVTEMLGGFISTKFKAKIHHVASLSQLAREIDVTAINIPPRVLLHNRKVEDDITVPRHVEPVFGRLFDPRNPPRIWDVMLEYLTQMAPYVEGVFRVSPRSDLLEIVRCNCDRGQMFELADYGPHVAASLLKRFLRDCPEPALPADRIPLPIKDDAEYTEETLRDLPVTSLFIFLYVVPLLQSIVRNTQVTRHTEHSISVCFAPAMLGITASRDSTAVGIRLLKNVIEHWAVLAPKLENELYTRINVTDVTRIHQLAHNSGGLGSAPAYPPYDGAYDMSKRQVSAPITFLNSSKSSPSLRQRNVSDAAPVPPFPISVSVESLVDIADEDAQLSPVKSRGRQMNHNDLSPQVELMPPPPVPKKPVQLKSRSRHNSVSELAAELEPPGTPKTPSKFVLQPSTKINADIDPSTFKIPPSPPPPRKFGPRSRSVASTKRGKMVEELSKMFEERCETANMMLEFERHRQIRQEAAGRLNRGSPEP
ncbi:Protein ECM25 [Yarrowia sp. C11]|nr:Protein ECM25 [Yarrowia sp. E02]KAG5372544.1 Protein ECM25 [Yarrowia sp. C11]